MRGMSACVFIRIRCVWKLDPAQMAAALEKREEICSVLKKLGFSYITLDLEGFRSGSMDLFIEK